MSQEPQDIPLEVLPPESGPLATQAPDSRPASLALREYLFTFPALVPVRVPTITLDECDTPFPHRFGAAVIYSIQAFQFYLSPSGAFGAFLRVFLRWFFFLIAVVLLLGIPALIASQFASSVSALLHTAAEHFFYAVCYFLGGCALLAAAFALLLYFLAKRK
jgi:hypothetical protein